ncbi:MAG: DUF2029 domain-containing protein [Paracoccaceae bacterium]|nr:DUF2029 domain-containing protein [Paracoccaceae bacterium]MDE3237672.1 DUF2029 domain-containing protein [Paracoccaceae bacterium]
MQGSTGARDHVPFPQKLATSVAIAVMLFTAYLIFFQVRRLSGAFGPATFIDFDAFRVAGHLALHGKMVSAYTPKDMYAAEAAMGGVGLTMPWAYPPQFDLVVPVFAILPRAVTYAIYTPLGLGLLLLVIWRLSGRDISWVIMAASAALVRASFSGQTSFIMAALAGWFALAMLKNGRYRGIPLGLMVIKPHMALGIGALALIRRDWHALGQALTVVLITGALATVVYGVDIWPAFLHGVEASGQLMHDGKFVFFRMMSTFIALVGLGVPAAAAMKVQAFVAVAALGLLVAVVRRGIPLRDQLGLAMLCTLIISPYAYDYDMLTYMVAIALLWPGLKTQARPGLRGLLLITGFAATGWSTYLSFTHGAQTAIDAAVKSGQMIVFPGLLLVALTVAVAVFLLRQPQAAQATVPQPA